MSRRHSFETINYKLRPNKQVERKMIAEHFKALSRHGWDISNYTYVGMGSIHYVDFVFFHRTLNIDHMICYENSSAKRRMMFNKPYEFVEVRMESIASIANESNFRDTNYVVWIDSDVSLDPDVHGLFADLLASLKEGSVVIVTVNAEPSSYLGGSQFESRGPELLGRFRDLFGNKALGLRPSDFTRRKFPLALGWVFDKTVQEVMSRRRDRTFLKLFNYYYSDNAQMMTYGGLVESSECQFPEDLVLGKASVTATEITVPILTGLERSWLNQHIDQVREDPDAIVEACAFEIKVTDVKNYGTLYRHYPVYAEIID